MAVQKLYDVVVESFPEGAALDLVEVFGIDPASADALVARKNVTVRRSATADVALGYADALRAIGAAVSVQPSGQAVHRPPEEASATGAEQQPMPAADATPEVATDYWQRTAWALPLHRLSAERP